MNFWSIYQHGFARVAACTGHTVIADPRANAAVRPAPGAPLLRRGRRGRRLPRAGPDRLLDRGPAVAGRGARRRRGRARARSWPPRRTCCRCSSSARRCGTGTGSTTARSSCTAAGSSASCPSPTRRTTASSTSAARSPPARTSAAGTIQVAGQAVPFGVDLLFAAEDVPGLVLHAEICEDMWVPVPPSAQAALAGATVLVNLSGSPITVGRAEDRRLLCRSASSRCLAAYVYAAAGLGESSTDLSWDGQTMIYENGALLAETERFPLGDAMAVADVDLDLLRQERMRMGTFDDNRRANDALDRRLPARRVPPRPAARRPRTAPQGRALPVRARPTPPGWRWTATRPTTSRSARLQQRLGAIGDPKVVIGVSGGLDSTHALIVAARAMDRAGRPRSDILAFTMPGFATGEHTKGNAHKLMSALGVTAAELDITADRAADAQGDGPSVRLRRAGVRRHLRERPGRAAHRLPVPAGQPARRHRAGHRRPVGAGAGLVHLRRRRPDEPLQRQLRRPEDPDPAPDPLGGGQRAVRRRRPARSCSRSWTPRSAPSWCPGEELQSTEAKIGPYALHDFTLFHVLRYGFRPSKIAFLAWHAWHDAEAGAWPPNFPPAKRVGVRPGADPALARGVLPPLLRLRAVQALGDAERAEGAGRRIAVAARRLARAVGRDG